MTRSIFNPNLIDGEEKEDNIFQDTLPKRYLQQPQLRENHPSGYVKTGVFGEGGIELQPFNQRKPGMVLGKSGNLPYWVYPKEIYDEIERREKPAREEADLAMARKKEARKRKFAQPEDQMPWWLGGPEIKDTSNWFMYKGKKTLLNPDWHDFNESGEPDSFWTKLKAGWQSKPVQWTKDAFGAILGMPSGEGGGSSRGNRKYAKKLMPFKRGEGDEDTIGGAMARAGWNKISNEYQEGFPSLRPVQESYNKYSRLGREKLRNAQNAWIHRTDRNKVDHGEFMPASDFNVFHKEPLNLNKFETTLGPQYEYKDQRDQSAADTLAALYNYSGPREEGDIIGDAYNDDEWNHIIEQNFTPVKKTPITARKLVRSEYADMPALEDRWIPYKGTDVKGKSFTLFPKSMYDGYDEEDAYNQKKYSQYLDEEIENSAREAQRRLEKQQRDIVFSAQKFRDDYQKIYDKEGEEAAEDFWYTKDLPKGHIGQSPIPRINKDRLREGETFSVHHPILNPDFNNLKIPGYGEGFEWLDDGQGEPWNEGQDNYQLNNFMAYVPEDNWRREDQTTPYKGPWMPNYKNYHRDSPPDVTKVTKEPEIDYSEPKISMPHTRTPNFTPKKSKGKYNKNYQQGVNFISGLGEEGNPNWI